MARVVELRFIPMSCENQAQALNLWPWEKQWRVETREAPMGIQTSLSANCEPLGRLLKLHLIFLIEQKRK